MRQHRFRGVTAIAALSAALAISAIAPSLASGQNVVSDLLQGLGLGGQGAPAAGVPGGSGYQPPAHGNNPHGQGTTGTVDILPSNTLPLSEDPAGGEDPDQEEVVVGRSRGEQNGSSYHGHITILALFGNEVVGVDTDPGQTESGPLEPIQQNILDAICTGSGGQLCLAVLQADSSTTNTGSQNSFGAVRASLGGEEGLNVRFLESNGNIEGDSSCQTAHGDSTVTHVDAGGRQLEVDVAESSSDSQACNNGSKTVNQDSRWIEINGNQIPVPCESGTPDAAFTGLSPLFSAVCNADDTNGAGEPVSQMDEPYGVREALTLFLFEFIPNGDTFLLALPEEETALLKGTVAASESHAVAPPAPPTPVSNPPAAGTGAGGQAGQQGAGPDEGEGPGGPVAEEAGPGRGDLAFTGTDMLILALIGMGLVMAGLATTRLAVRRRRATV